MIMKLLRKYLDKEVCLIMKLPRKNNHKKLSDDDF